MPTYQKCAKVSEINPGSGKAVTLGENQIAVFNVDGKVYACGNTCAHRGGPLAEGLLEGTSVTCPWHGWKYDVTNGRCAVGVQVTVPSYKTKVEGDDIFVEV